MSQLPLPIRTLLLLAFVLCNAHAQTATPTSLPPAHKPRPRTPQYPYNPNIVLLDPAHGGSDSGARLAEDSLEKDATVALADKIKTLLANRGFTVILTHDSASDQTTPDQRVELANRSRASACILLHASNGGHGVHLFTSSLPPVPVVLSSDPAEPKAILPWASAQNASLPESQHLASTFADAFDAMRVPLVVGQASVQPIDSITCPALAIEVSPLLAADDRDAATPASDDAYQQRIASAIASALSTWRGHIMAQIAGAAMATTPIPTPAKPPATKPKPAQIPVETPVEGPPQ